jgi:hypothetical protein
MMRKPTTRTIEYKSTERTLIVITMQSFAETTPDFDETESSEALPSCFLH